MNAKDAIQQEFKKVYPEGASWKIIQSWTEMESVWNGAWLFFCVGVAFLMSYFVFGYNPESETVITIAVVAIFILREIAKRIASFFWIRRLLWSVSMIESCLKACGDISVSETVRFDDAQRREWRVLSEQENLLSSFEVIRLEDLLPNGKLYAEAEKLFKGKQHFVSQFENSDSGPHGNMRRQDSRDLPSTVPPTVMRRSI